MRYLQRAREQEPVPIDMTVNIVSNSSLGIINIRILERELDQPEQEQLVWIVLLLQAQEPPPAGPNAQEYPKETVSAVDRLFGRRKEDVPSSSTPPHGLGC